MNEVGIHIDGIVAGRDREPYVRLTVNGEETQLTVAEAHKIANDLVKVASRTEADAMVLKFFDREGFPEGAGVAIMQEFRYFRQAQDDKPVDATTTDPDSGERVR